MIIFLRKKFTNLVIFINRHLRKLSYKTHAWQHRLQWDTKEMPEWYDHYLDLHYYWRKKRNPLWLERGCFNNLVIKPEATVLELCCGDGFNAYYFYSEKAKSVKAVDFDPKCLKHAKENHQAPNINFELCDLRKNFPAGSFDNIIWDAAIEHFTSQEISQILEQIKNHLQPGGILSGYTIVEINPGYGLPQHETEFATKKALLDTLSPYFKYVKIFETVYQSRHNLYFYASRVPGLPFDNNWPYLINNY